MPATSQAQQKLFGLVRALQKGEVPASSVTSNVRQIAKDTSPEDVKDMASTKLKGLPKTSDQPNTAHDDSDNEKKEGLTFEEIVGRYNEYGKILKREHTLSELAQQLADIAEYAEYALTNETNDWFDAHTIRRNLKEMGGYVKEFQKLAGEADVHNQRMTALYDDMGRVLERYFEIYDGASLLDNTDHDYEKDAKKTFGQHAKYYKQEPTNQPVDSYLDTDDTRKEAIRALRDSMSQRAVSLLRERLKGSRLARFDSLSPERQVKMAWRLL